MIQKKNLKFIVLSAILLFLVSACNSGPKDTGGAPKTPFLGGTSGLQVGFLEGSPPAEVSDGNSFPFQAIVSVKNNGETDIAATNAKTSLVGFLPSLFGSGIITSPATAPDFIDADLKDKTLPEALNGKHRDSEGNIIESVESFVAFPKDGAQFNFRGSITGNTVAIFRADVCYKYQTRAVSEVCVLQNQIDVAKDALCTPSGTKTIFSSTSPIQVGSFKQNVVGKERTQFSFDITHAGQGGIFGTATTIAEPAAITATKTVIDAAITAATASPNAANVAAIVTAKVILYSAITGAPLSSSDITTAETNLDAAITAATASPNAANVAAIATARDSLYTAITSALTGVDCPKDPTVRRTKEDNIKVTVTTGIGTAGQLKCVGLTDSSVPGSASGTVKLTSGKRSITCTQELPAGRTDFKKTVDVTVDFNYLTSADKEVLVKHLINS